MLEGIVIDEADVFNDKLQEWEDFYNFNRPHGGLDGQTPYERLRQKTKTMPDSQQDGNTTQGPGVNHHRQLHI